MFQAIIGGIGGAVKGIFGPVINIARKVKTKQKTQPNLTTVTQVKGGIIGGVGGLIQAKGAIISAGGSALQNLGKKIAGDGDGGNNGGNIASNTTMKTILTLPTLLIVTLCT